MNNIFGKHTQFKKITKYKLKFRTKPSIIPALQKFISIKNKIFKNYIQKKYITQKNELYNNYKIYRNLISALMKRSKQNYYSKLLESNLSNIKNNLERHQKYNLYEKLFIDYCNFAYFSEWNYRYSNKDCKYFQNYFRTIGKLKYSYKN